MRVAVYARFSSENQKESSITDQYRVCEDYVARQPGWQIVHRYRDEAISGAVGIEGRDGYRAMLADAEDKQFDVLVIHDLSRLSRDFRETDFAREQLVYWGVRMIGVTDGIDTQQEGHEMMARVHGIMNDDFRKKLAVHVRKAMVGQTKLGLHGGGRAYGDRLVPVYHSTKKDPYGQPDRDGTRLEIDPAHAKWVKWIFQRYADGMSPMKIVEELNRQQVPPPGVAFRRKSTEPPTWCASALSYMVM